LKTNPDNGEFIQQFYFNSDPNIDNSPDSTA